MAYEGPARFKLDPIEGSRIDVLCTWINCRWRFGFVQACTLPNALGLMGYLWLDGSMVFDRDSEMWRMTARALRRIKEGRPPRLRRVQSRDNSHTTAYVLGDGIMALTASPVLAQPWRVYSAFSELCSAHRLKCPRCGRVSIVAIEAVRRFGQGAQHSA